MRTGLLFAVAGMLGAPLGSYLSTLVPENVLLVMFAVLMFVVAQRMWSKAVNPVLPSGVCAAKSNRPDCEIAPGPDRSACQRDADGKLRLTSRCVRLLVSVGLMTGVLSGMFGVGGGFVIVPALVIFSGMAIHQAVGTSLFVIVLVSISGVASHIAQRKRTVLRNDPSVHAGRFRRHVAWRHRCQATERPHTSKSIFDRGCVGRDLCDFQISGVVSNTAAPIAISNYVAQILL